MLSESIGLESSDSDSSDDGEIGLGSQATNGGGYGYRSRGRRSGLMTFGDMFLRGGETFLNEAHMQLKGKFIPDPPGVLSPKKVRKKFQAHMKQHEELMQRQRHEQVQRALESKVQDYWKAFANWPPGWPEMEQARQEQRAFEAAFREASMVGAGKELEGAGGLGEGGPRSFKVYAVVAERPVGARDRPSRDVELQTGQEVRPGQAVIVESVVALQGERYLKLQSGDWVFEYAEDGHQALVELCSLEIGLWWYQVACKEFVEVRTTPSYGRRLRSGWVLCPGEVCVVSLRCMADGNPFLQLADGRGWVFQLRSAEAMMAAQTSSPVVMELCDAMMPSEEESLELEAFASSKAKSGVESGSWQYQVLDQPVMAIGTNLRGATLQPGEPVVVDLRAPANGKNTRESSKIQQGIENRIWLRLGDGRGWIPKNDADGKALVRFVGASHPRQRRPRKDAYDEPPEQWMSGVA